jgi:hypothetical protein
MWFSYYGPIHHAEASEALDAAITSHLQEIGSSSTIPIRKEVAEQVVVPIGLNTPPFTEENGAVVVHFAASAPGHLTFESDGLTESHDFPEGLDLTYCFRPSDPASMALRFEFDVDGGVSGRIFVLVMNGKTLPMIVDDRVVVNGVESSVSRVFLGQETGPNGDGDFSDGLCLICCNEPATVIAYPCRHCCMCRECSEKFATLSNHCPVCRATVLELIDCGAVDAAW